MQPLEFRVLTASHIYTAMELHIAEPLPGPSHGPPSRLHNTTFAWLLLLKSIRQALPTGLHEVGEGIPLKGLP